MNLTKGSTETDGDANHQAPIVDNVVLILMEWSIFLVGSSTSHD